MIEFKKSCYEAVVPFDERESTVVGYFINRIDAEKATKGTGWYGSNGHVNDKSIHIKIFESYEEFEHRNDKSTLEELLDKLSEREIGLLKQHFVQK